MLLLDLPSELFRLIFDNIVESRGSRALDRDTVGLRLVCRTFNVAIMSNLVQAAVKLPFTNPGGSADFFWLMRNEHRVRLCSTDILCSKVLRQTETHAPVQDVRLFVDELVARDSPADLGDMEKTHSIYARNVCDAIRALGYSHFTSFLHGGMTFGPAILGDMLPAAGVAVGNIQMILDNISKIEDVFAVNKVVFPNALEAAVAANQTETVEVILRWTMATVRGFRETGSWDEMRIVGHGFAEALGVAIAMSRTTAGDMILEVLAKHPILTKTIRWSVVRQLYEDCVKYGNTDFFPTVLYWKRKGKLPMSTAEPGLHGKLSRVELLYVFKNGLLCLLNHLIKNGRIDVNVTDGETTLWLALGARRHVVADLLPEAGADVDGLAPGQTRTAYWRAHDLGSGNDQVFLIEAGADTRLMSEHGTPRDLLMIDYKPE